VQRLSGGDVNCSVLVADGLRQWVVRLDGLDPGSIGLSRDAEWRALHKAAENGIAPEPVYRNPQLGALVCTYHAPDSGAIDSIAAVAALLRKIHALPPVKYRLDPMQRARRYADIAGNEGLPETLLEPLERLSSTPVELTLCHNDLLSANRLWSEGRLLALDWEYVACGDPLFDLAAIIEGDGLTDEEACALLEAWQTGEPTPETEARLRDQRSVYRELSTLWENAVTALAD
jgi:hypothetical protein